MDGLEYMIMDLLLTNFIIVIHHHTIITLQDTTVDHTNRHITGHGDVGRRLFTPLTHHAI